MIRPNDLQQLAETLSGMSREVEWRAAVGRATTPHFMQLDRCSTRWVSQSRKPNSFTPICGDVY